MLKKLLAFVFSSLLLFGCGVEKQKETPPANVANKTVQSEQFTKPLRVAHVVDGDTIIVVDGNDRVKVRLIGIDTPESVHRDEAKNTREGKIVSERLARLLTNNKVQLEFDEERQDKYGRLLAYVYFDGNMVNKMLLDAGLARTLSIPPNTKYADVLAEAEAGAKADATGFWGRESDLFVR